MNEIIRPLRLADMDDVASDCFPEQPREEVEERVREGVALQESGGGVCLVAEIGGRVGAFARLFSRDDAGWVFDVTAAPQFRGRGVIPRLLHSMSKLAREMGLKRLLLHVREDNPRARRAYEKAGFKCVGQDGMRGAQLRYEKRLEP